MGIFKKARNALIDRALTTNTGRKAAMRAAAAMGNGIIYRNLGDHRLVVDSSELIGRSVLARGHFTRDLLDATIAQLASEDRLVPHGAFIDVGANIGTHTVYAALSRRFARFVAIEPDPRTCEILSANIALNALGGRAVALNCAAGGEPGTLDLHRVAENSGAATLRPAGQRTTGERLSVPVCRLDDILAQSGLMPGDIGLVWIDVEGFEPEVWAGMAGVIAARRPIVLEFSPDLYGPERTARFIADMQAAYPRIARLDGDRAVDLAPSDLGALRGQHDLVLSA